MLIKRVGGKTKIAAWIVSHLPRCKIFVDVFGGSGAILHEVQTQRLYERYVYNDADEKIYLFFKVLQSDPTELAHLVHLTPYSRSVFQEAHNTLNSSDNEIDLALAFMIVNRQSFGAKMSKDWSITLDGEINYDSWNSLPKYILKTAKTWKSVFLENLDYTDLINKWDSENTLFYLDPPYEKVEQKYYRVNKQSGFDHTSLFDTLQSICGAYAVSYYGGDNSGNDTDLINLYKNAGCRIFRKKVTKHLSAENTKDIAVEVLITNNKHMTRVRTQEIDGGD